MPMELSADRVISWWVWVWAVFVLWAVLQRIGVRPGSILLASLVGATGLGLIFAALLLIRQGTESVTAFPLRIGLIYSCRRCSRCRMFGLPWGGPFNADAAQGPPRGTWRRLI